MYGVLERIEIINKNIWVDCPQCSRVERVVKNMLSARGVTPAPCLLVCGEGGAGKTSIISRISSKYAAVDGVVAFASLSENPDNLRFRDLLLLALGVPLKAQGGAGKIPNGLEKYLQLRKISAIVIDEFHDALLAQLGEQRKNLSLLKTLSGPPYHLRVMGFGTFSAVNALKRIPSSKDGSKFLSYYRGLKVMSLGAFLPRSKKTYHFVKLLSFILRKL